MELFINDLTVIDCSLLSQERGLVGESWQVDLVLVGGLDAQSMVLDFGEVKRRIKSLIDDLVDHRLLVPTEASEIHVEPEGKRSWGPRWCTQLRSPSGSTWISLASVGTSNR